jgi:HEAT repeat protein
MAKTRAKKAIVLVLGAAGIGGAIAAAVSRRNADGDAPKPSEPGFPRFVMGTSEAIPAPDRVASAEDVAREVESAMAAWRSAIGVRDADAVVRLDSTFQASPERYRDALVGSAGGDADERVRAFSTRVLGKLRQADLAETFRKLLQDASPFVRQNAAWALGELGAESTGRAAAQRALAELRQAKKRDPAGDVRTAAVGAIQRLE